MPAIFISHSSRDNKIADNIKSFVTGLGFEHTFLDFDKDTGFGAGADWERHLYAELTRSHAVILVLTPNWFSSKWCFAEFTQARALGKVVLPVVCMPLGEQDILPQIQKVDLINRDGDGLKRIEKRLRAIADELARGFILPANRPPYPGIHSFEAEDAAIYFGRDEETRAVIERLEARRVRGGARLLLVIGASGSGKSSLLKAGVLPQLARLRRHWIIFPPLRPEREPLEALAKAIAHEAGKEEALEDWYGKLKGPRAIDELAALAKRLRIGDASSATLLLPIDQFEEVFTVAKVAERTAFLALLADILEPERALPLMALATGRADVLQGLLEASALADLIETISLTPMPLDRVRRLVEGPARVAGLAVDEELAERIKDDVETPEALPLLAYMLALLYGRCKDGKRLTIATYLGLGDAERRLNPVQNAIRLAADQAITSLRPKPDQKELVALRDAFVPHLVHLRLDDNKRVRQPAQRVDLPTEAERLLDALINARLLTARSEEQQNSKGSDGAVVEVTHEALFDAWPVLKGWLDEEQDFLIDLARLQSAHETWQNANDSDRPSALLQGLLLTRARHWLAKYPRRFYGASMEPLRAFIVASWRKVQWRRLRVGAFVIGTLAALVIWWEWAWLKERSYSLAYSYPQEDRALKLNMDFLECADCPKMMVIPTGHITIGSPDSSNEQPPHPITITRPFAVAVYELTFAQWDACATFGDCRRAINDPTSRRDHQSVIHVSWKDAQQYVDWLRRITGKHYRLLTEAEWEYAARAGSSTHFSFGPSEAQLQQYAWYALNADRQPHPVGTRDPNRFGLYDMHGNVSEWVEDCYRDNYRGADPEGAAWTAGNCDHRVIRGGSWQHRSFMVRSAARDYLSYDKGNQSIGIRVGRSIEP